MQYNPPLPLPPPCTKRSLSTFIGMTVKCQSKNTKTYKFILNSLKSIRSMIHYCTKCFQNVNRNIHLTSLRFSTIAKKLCPKTWQYIQSLSVKLIMLLRNKSEWMHFTRIRDKFPRLGRRVDWNQWIGNKTIQMKGRGVVGGKGVL